MAYAVYTLAENGSQQKLPPDLQDRRELSGCHLVIYDSAGYTVLL